ncbi:MAG: NAD(P)-dependent alcohol dehydrogenase [Candidatus Latescibacterota bacterium]
MKCVKLHRAGDLRVAEIPRPEPAAGEVLVRITAVGVCGSDVHYFKDGRIGDTPVESPLILGHEPAGVIEAVGEGVTRVKAGDRVAVDPALPCGVCEWCIEGNANLCPNVRFFGTPPTDGAFREFLTHPAHAVFKLPDSLSFEEGAMLEPFGVAIHAVDLGKVRAADTVAILGAGSIGLSVLQMARLSGAAGVFVTDLIESRLDLARRLGADVAIGAEDDPVRRILQRTGGRGVDVVFEAAGAMETPQQAIELLKPGGTLVLIGICPEDRIPLRASAARRKGVTIRMSRRMKHVIPRAIRLAERNMVDLKCLVTHRYPLERIAEAFDVVGGYRDGVVKAIITMEE